MPSCLTKWFAESRSPSASQSLSPPSPPRARMTSPPATLPPRAKSGLAKLRNRVASWARAPRNELKKPPNNANRRDVPPPRNAVANATAILLARRPIRRAARPVPEITRRSNHTAVAAIALTAVYSIGAHAYSDEAARQFKSGSSAFQAGNYETALDAFQAAVAGGMSGPAVHFNIGVASFRLGRYSQAESAFQEVARTPAMAGLAYYNLGLVAVRKGDTEAATRWFSMVEQTTADERLRDLAATQLGELAPPPPDRNWLGYAAAAAGYDDNVALVSNSDVLGISGTEDSFIEAQLAISAPLAQPWRVDAGLSYIDYQDLDSFDQLGLNGGGRYRWNIGDWTHVAGLQLAYTMLDGEGFESRRTLLLQTTTHVLGDSRLRLRYRYNDIDGLDEFSGLSGRRHEAGARVTWTRATWDFGAEYQLEVGDYDDASLSATRQRLGVELQRSFSAGWAVMLEASQRHSDYDLASNGSEDRTELALSISKTMGDRWRVIVRHAYTNNSADVAEFDYRGNRISAGFEAMM
jgi:tetratricopeptide (TPR) repeat protein